MGLFRRNSHDIIHVRYLDAANGKVFAQVKLPISKLPESFEASTTLHRGEEDWQVIEARPVTAAEFRRAGDDLNWLNTDFILDGTHPNPTGRQKVAKLLLHFFKTDPTAKTWFCGLTGS
jgi:lysophospholipase L1-like esterase